jgi:hypothetical protein
VGSDRSRALVPQDKITGMQQLFEQWRMAEQRCGDSTLTALGDSVR